jgi:hypothetical protein
VVVTIKKEITMKTVLVTICFLLMVACSKKTNPISIPEVKDPRFYGVWTDTIGTKSDTLTFLRSSFTERYTIDDFGSYLIHLGDWEIKDSKVIYYEKTEMDYDKNGYLISISFMDVPMQFSYTFEFNGANELWIYNTNGTNTIYKKIR